MFSIICVFNNSKKLDQYLIKSLEQQTVPFELITIDNTEGNYRAAAPVLNQAAKSARHEYLMFVHQDVALDSEDWLARAANDMKTLDGRGCRCRGQETVYRTGRQRDQWCSAALRGVAKIKKTGKRSNPGRLPDDCS